MPLKVSFVRCQIYWSNRYVLLVLCALCVMLAQAQSQPPVQAAQYSEPLDFAFARPYFENVGDRDAIPGGVVTAIARTPDGMMWFGTQTGLLRYDGYRFKLYEFDPLSANSIAGNFINALEATPEGLLWIGTSNDGVSILDPKAERFRNFRHVANDKGSISDGAVTAFAYSKEGMWVGTQTGLDRFDTEQNQFLHFPAPAAFPLRPNLDRIRSLRVDRLGNLWVGTWDGVRFKAKTASEILPFMSEPATPGFAGQVINCILQTQDDSMWIGTRQHGIARMRPDGSALMRINADVSIAQAGVLPLVSNRVQVIMQPNPAEVWVATTAGINVLDASAFRVKQHFVSDKSQVGALALDAIGAMLKDESGLIWIGTWGGGLQKLQANNPGFRSLRMDAKGTAGLSFADVHAALELADGRIWIGTGGNGIDIFDRMLGRIDAHRIDTQSGNGLLDGTVVTMVQAQDTSVWVGTQTGGLFHVNPATGKFKRVGAAGSVSDLLIAKDGVLWLGGTQGVAKLLPSAELDSLKPEIVMDTEGKPVLGQVNPLAQDHQGRIWAGSADGLRVLVPGESRFRIIRHDADRPDSLIHNSVFGLLVDRAGSLWVATEQGIDRLQVWSDGQARFQHVSAELGRPGRDLGANLLEDEVGRIWTYSAVIDLAAKRIYSLTRAEGVDIGTAWTGAYGRTRDGLFMHGGTEGLLIIDPKQFQPWAYAPNVVATELRINGLTVPVGTLTASPMNSAASALPGLMLSPKQRSFSVEFSSLDFSSPNDNRYRYRLDGFDQGWIETGTGQRTASYSNLSPGRYALEVQGSNRIGSWSPNALKIPVRILPSFWQTPWFYVLIGLAAITLSMLALGWRTRALRRAADRLQGLVNERTLALENSNVNLISANNALESARLRLIETQEKLLFQEKMASMGQLVAGVAHEVNTPLGIAVTASSFLQLRTDELAQQIESGALRKTDLERFASDSKASSVLLSEHLQRAVHLIAQFKQVSIQQNFDVRQTLPLELLLDNVILSTQPLWAGRAITFVYSGAPLQMLDTYTGAVSQAISQLLQNALIHAFAPEQSGTLTLTCSTVGSKDDPEVEIAVTDDGLGMDATHKAQVFEPFFTTKRNQGGIGLGLHIVFNIVTARLGGTILVDSVLGKGTRFIARFPATLRE